MSNEEVYLIIGGVFGLMTIFIILKYKNFKEGIILEKKNLPSSKFMAFQYKIEVKKEDGSVEILKTSVLMIDKEIGETIKF